MTVDDEDQPRASVGVGPRRHVDGRMDEMLHAVDGDRRGRARDVQDALHPQHLLAMAVEQHGQPQAEQGPVERPVEAEREGVDGLVVPVAIVRAPSASRGAISAANQRRAASLRPAVANRSCDSSAAASSGASAARHSGAEGLSRRSRADERVRRLPHRRGRSWSAPAGRPRPPAWCIRAGASSWPRRSPHRPW